MNRRGAHRTSLLLPLAAAAYGLGVAIVLAPLTLGPPQPGQLPGGMLQRGLDARAPMRMMLLAMGGPIIAALLLTPLLRRLDGAAAWARMALAASLAGGLWIAIVDPNQLVASILLPLMLAGAAFQARTIEARFTRRDLILIPSAFTLFASTAVIPLALGAPLAAATIVAIRVIVGALQPRVNPAYTFVLAPAALLLDVHAWFRDELAYVALAIALLSPFLLAFTLRRPPRRLLVRVVYPLFALALMASTSALSAERAPSLDLFEDGHWLMPANEMMHGATPYRDIVPGHGFINDGLLEYVVMRFGATNAGQVLFIRRSLTLLLAPALYVVTLLLAGSAEAALVAVIAAAGMILTGISIPGDVTVLEAIPSIRPLPALLALACCLAALRRHDRRPLVAAGAFATLAFLTSVDYGFYAFVVLAMTIVRWKSPATSRLTAIAHASAGAAAVAGVAAIGMLRGSYLLAFLRVTFVEIPRLTGPYALQFFYWPPQFAEMLGMPDLLSCLFSSRVIWIVLWCLIAIATAAALAATRPPDRTADAVIVAGTWVVAGAISYGERAHVVFMLVAVAVIVAGIYALRRNRTALAIGVIALAAACAPTQLLLRAHTRLQWHGPLDPVLVRYDALPRAQGASIDRRNAQRLFVMQLVAARTLGPDDTFYDFANMPALYYLFDRRCPIRLYEVPFYETDALQREVIAALEQNSHVKLAVMQFTNRDDAWIDGVPNSVRAPLVYSWLRGHFQPLVERDGVVLWIRR